MSKRPRSPDASVTPARDADPDGDAFLQRLIAEQIQADTEDANPSSDVQEEILDNEDIFSIDTMDSLDDDVFSDAASMRPEHNLDVVLINDVSENEVSGNAPPPHEIAITEVEVEWGGWQQQSSSSSTTGGGDCPSRCGGYL